MYYLFLSNGRRGWIEYSKSERKADLDDVARAIGIEIPVRITGSEGKWTRPRDRRTFVFTPLPRGNR